MLTQDFTVWCVFVTIVKRKQQQQNVLWLNLNLKIYDSIQVKQQKKCVNCEKMAKHGYEYGKESKKEAKKMMSKVKTHNTGSRWWR